VIGDAQLAVKKTRAEGSIHPSTHDESASRIPGHAQGARLAPQGLHGKRFS